MDGLPDGWLDSVTDGCGDGTRDDEGPWLTDGSELGFDDGKSDGISDTDGFSVSGAGGAFGGVGLPLGAIVLKSSAVGICVGSGESGAGGLFGCGVGMPLGAAVGAAVGAVVLKSTQVSDPASINIQLSKRRSDTSAITNLTLFHPSPLPPSVGKILLAISFVVNPSASTDSY